ncbi:hypothetical protein [Vibrio vulnificus]|uniref:T1SS secreted agglutinin RTX n=1 Tax=Vibrio vulnificus TaxID=672 RepID=A0AAN1PNR7_VIBVL|nr:hypothetical protein [Vibrio vulnificus]AXX59960.1 T1SS secreted agglutinin RTX [Vibrio vulnificus]
MEPGSTSAVEALAEGTQTIKADVSDEAGNPAPTSHDIEVDTEARDFITRNRRR